MKDRLQQNHKHDSMSAKKALKSLKKAQYDLGEEVQYNNPLNKDEGRITGISVREHGVCYLVTWSNKEEKYHYSFELKKPETSKTGFAK